MSAIMSGDMPPWPPMALPPRREPSTLPIT